MPVGYPRSPNLAQLNKADLFYQVLGIDASGEDALVTAPHFGVLSQRKISPLPAGFGELFGAAW